MVAFLCIGLSVGIVVGFMLAGMNASLYLNKIPNPDQYLNRTTIPTQMNNTETNNSSEWSPVTHFAFYDTGNNMGGTGFVGIYHPSTDLWYLRWHTVAIQEIGVRPGSVLVHYGYKDNSGTLHNATTVLVFTQGEIKQDLAFLIPVTEVTKEEIDYGTVFIELLGEK